MRELIVAIAQIPPWSLLVLAGGVVLGVALWTARRGNRQRLDDRNWLLDELDRRQDEYHHALDGARQDLLTTLARSQVLTQESQQRAVSALLGNVEQRLNALARQTLQDGSSLRTDLVGRFETLKRELAESLGQGRLSQNDALHRLREALDSGLSDHREAMDRRQAANIQAQQEALLGAMQGMGRQLTMAFQGSAGELSKRVELLTQTTDAHLKEISGQVAQRLTEGFKRTTETFTQVLEHLARIDEAQKRINELSADMVSLQEVLTDKRSRGAFGEVQLENLIANMLPESSYRMQATLSNGMRVDCLLQMPDPTGAIPIDAKFPLESFRRMTDFDLPETERAGAARQFRVDIRRHIQAVADKYLIAGETAEGAVLFLPAEAIFAEIHARFPDLVEEAQRRRVWLVSPTTLMAVLTTARAVLKDDATRRQIHIIRDHLRRLADDFRRFRQRMETLARHIAQVHADADQVTTSARKLVDRFDKIENVQIQVEEAGEQTPAQPLAKDR